MYKVLLVEDDPVCSSSINKLLLGFCNVHTTSSTNIALHLTTANKYNLVMIDVNLRSSNSGVGTANSIRNMNGYGIIPIVAYASIKLTESREYLLSRGYTHLIPEPYNIRNFAQQIKFILTSKQNTDDPAYTSVEKMSAPKLEY